ncbi:mCG13682, isoform CRA_a [Mus musculus]|nr:mCG13682, isoform CRA_a [Mus musculus]
MGQRLKERPSRDCPTLESIPSEDTKLQHYCGCQETRAWTWLCSSAEGYSYCCTAVFVQISPDKATM